MKTDFPFRFDWVAGSIAAYVSWRIGSMNVVPLGGSARGEMGLSGEHTILWPYWGICVGHCKLFLSLLIRIDCFKERVYVLKAGGWTEAL